MKSRNFLTIQSLAFASQLLPAVIGLLSFMLLVRLVDAEALGAYLMYMAAVVLFEMIKSGGLQSALVMRLSGREGVEKLQILGSAYVLGGILSSGISLVLLLLYVFDIFGGQPGISVFCGWYALLGLVTLPLHIAEAAAVSRQDLRFLLGLRLAQSANAVLIAGYAWVWGGHLGRYATVHLLFTTALALVVIATGNAFVRSFKHRLMAEVKALFHLMKFTLATLATTNLLKSADTFLIGGLMGPKAVAAYAVPLKLTELFEIPLRSLSTTAFPQLAAASNERDMSGFRSLLVQYSSWVYLLYIPALMAAFVLAPLAVTILGGAQYAATASVFRVFCIYGLFLPADRITGISLDALQKPGKNFIKVTCMAIINIAGDLAAIHLGGTLEWVAAASVLNAVTGALLGYSMLRNATGPALHRTGQECVLYATGFMRKGLQKFITKAA